MRKILFFFKASYPFVLLLILGCLASQLSLGQAVYNASADYLYSWCSYLRAPGPLPVDLPVLKLATTVFIPGPCLLLTDGGNLNSLLLKGGDSLLTMTGEADTADVKDAGPMAQAAPAYAGSTTTTLPASVFDDATDILLNHYADMLSVTTDEVNNIHLYKFIDQWYGVRYKWGGNDNTGIDCSGFSQKLYGSIYSLTILRTARQQHRNCDIIKDYSEAAEGDLVFFRMHHLGISHVGVYLTNGYFVHASRSRGVIISNLEEKYWHRRYAGCGRIEKEDLSGTESGTLQ
jgi:hypothetical protein